MSVMVISVVIGTLISMFFTNKLRQLEIQRKVVAINKTDHNTVRADRNIKEKDNRNNNNSGRRKSPRRVMHDSGLEVREFELLSRYYVHFWTNTIGKCMNPFILLAMG